MRTHAHTHAHTHTRTQTHTHARTHAHTLTHTHALQEWAPGSNVYVLGAYAALQLGPGALNLAGAKTGTALVVDTIRARAPGSHQGGGCARVTGGSGGCSHGRDGAGAEGKAAVAAGGGQGEGAGGSGWLRELGVLQARYLLPVGGA